MTCPNIHSSAPFLLEKIGSAEMSASRCAFKRLWAFPEMTFGTWSLQAIHGQAAELAPCLTHEYHVLRLAGTGLVPTGSQAGRFSRTFAWWPLKLEIFWRRARRAWQCL